ncbi:MAG TPA: glycosyltransferase [Caulobacteraceae bacterium]
MRVRVMLLLGSLDGGGAERVAVNLANHCNPSLVDLRLGLLRRHGPYLEEMDAGRVEMAASGSLWRAPLDIARMIRAAQPQVVMSFGMGVNMLTWLALKALGPDRPRWICREDSNPDAEIRNLLASHAGRAAVRKTTQWAYRSADYLLVVGHDLAAHLVRQDGFEPGRLGVIHNPIDLAGIERSAAEPLEVKPSRPFIVSAGRLVAQKGHDLLIKAFAECRAARDLDLVILGQGPLERTLKEQAAALGVADRVRFSGFQHNPWTWFAHSRLFVLPSRWEGFGNVVAEALACGAPVLVSDCDFGPREQVEHGHSGWVAPSGDAGALARAMEDLLNDPVLAARLAAGGRARARAFDISRIVPSYAELFIEQASMHRPYRVRSGALSPRAPALATADGEFRLVVEE